MSDSFDVTGGGDGRARVSAKLRALLVAFGLTVASFLASLVGGVAFMIPVFVLSLDVESAPVFVALTVVGQLGILAVAYGYTRYSGLRISIRTPTLRQVGIGVGGALVALVVVMILSAVQATLGLVPESVIGEAVELEPLLLLAIAGLSIVLVAPAEEFLFRGVIQGRLRESFGPVGAVAGSSLLFGAMHLTNYTGEPGAVVGGALLIAGTGIVLGALYELTDNLTVPIVAHALYNVVLSGLAFATL